MTARWLRAVRRWFAGGNSCAPQPFLRHSRMAMQWETAVRVFYAVLFYHALQMMSEWNHQLTRKGLDPLWPVSWMGLVPQEVGVGAILLIYVAGAGLALMQPRWVAGRVALALGLLLYWAYNNSFGKIGHSLHGAVLMALVLVFLPGRLSKTRTDRHRTVLVCWTALATLLMTYTMAGWIKVVVALVQMWEGQVHIFQPDALARQVANRLMQTGEETTLGVWMIALGAWSFPFIMGVLYMEFVALWAAFRPRILPWIAGGLILFHVASFFTMTILFVENCVLLAVWGVLSPLAVGRDISWRRFWENLPGVRLVKGVFRRPR